MKTNAIYTIARQELRLLLRDRTFHVLAVILLLLTGYTVVTSQKRYSEHHTVHRQLVDTVRHMFEGQKNSAHMAGHYGHIVFKPASYLQAIDPGVSPFTGTTIRLEAHRQNEAVFAAASGQSSLIRFGEFSFALLLQMVFPLMIMFCCYRTVSDYRTDGTLKLLVSQGATLRKLVIAKIIAYTGIYWGFLALASLLYGSLYSLNGGAEDGGFLRTLSLLSVYAVYYLLLIAVTVYLSARTTDASGLLAGLLSSWFILTVIIPKSTASLGAQLHPLPTRQELAETIREKKKNGIDGHDNSNPYTKRFVDSVLQAYNVTDSKDLPFKIYGLLMEADENFNNRLYDETLEGVNQVLQSQNRIGSLASLIDPFQAVKNLSMASAGTDMNHHFHFTKEVEHYRRSLISKLNQQDALRQSAFKDSSGAIKSDFWKQVKDYHYHSPALKWTMKYYTLEITGLVLWLLVVSGIIWFSSNKIKVA